MKKVFINSVGSISSQKTFDNSGFLDDITPYEDNVINTVNPNYKDFIPPAAARRMAKGIKMGVVASKIALNEAGLDNVDAIITGTGMGCVQDSEKFVSSILDNDEQYLTPTSFIQSTHNTVGGQIALGLGCNGYNFTYVHSSISFESALLDAKMQLENDEASHILVGGVDEIGEHTIKVHRLVNHIKKEKVKTFSLLDSRTSGAVFSEGANFFVLSNKKRKGSYAELVGTNTFNSLSKNDIQGAAKTFLKENGLNTSDIDVLILGLNGDVMYDSFYHALQSDIFDHTQQVYYKHLCGEFNTASSFGAWLGAKILRSQRIPNAVKLNDLPPRKINNIVLYNQYRGENHSFTLLRKC